MCKPFASTANAVESLPVRPLPFSGRRQTPSNWNTALPTRARDENLMIAAEYQAVSKSHSQESSSSGQLHLFLIDILDQVIDILNEETENDLDFVRSR